MPENESETTDFDWRLTSFEGARREQLRRWAQLPLESILLAIEEMQEISQQLALTPAGVHGESARAANVKEPDTEYDKSDTL
ncbi:MAG: hypothetical protein HYR98_03410 [Nitrospirae bacterium]|nr:hypothetical protein [Nitrospirota bacterium]MBI3393667.1 hypothetical protein [Nitrospirota bacterium]